MPLIARRILASRIIQPSRTLLPAALQTTPFRQYSTKIECVNSTKAPKAVGPYSQAVKANGQIWSGEFPSEDITDQTRQALTNLVNVLEESNSSLERVVKTTVLLEDINDFKKVNEVYSEYFSTHKPARACYAVKDLPKGAKVEIEAIAIEE